MANLCLDAPHSVLTFIGLVHSAHLFGTLGQMFAIRAGKRVTQQNGIVLKTNEWKLCLIKVGPCFFGWGSINSNFFRYKRLMGGALQGLIEPYSRFVL